MPPLSYSQEDNGKDTLQFDCMYLFSLLASDEMDDVLPSKEVSDDCCLTQLDKK